MGAVWRADGQVAQQECRAGCREQLQAKVDTGEIDVLELYRLAGPIFKAEQAMMARRQVS